MEYLETWIKECLKRSSSPTKKGSTEHTEHMNKVKKKNCLLCSILFMGWLSSLYLLVGEQYLWPRSSTTVFVIFSNILEILWICIILVISDGIHIQTLSLLSSHWICILVKKQQSIFIWFSVMETSNTHKSIFR